MVPMSSFFFVLLLKSKSLLSGNLFSFSETLSLVRFRVVLSPQPTPATLYLIKRFKWAETEDISKLNQIEICPKAMDLTQSIAKRISTDGGGALIIDYGLNGIISDSLQVWCLISMHKIVHSFHTCLLLYILIIGFYCSQYNEAA